MGDIFHKQVPDEFIKRIQRVIADNEAHIFQLLTKRAERLRDFPEWPDNAWIGVTVDNNRARSLIKYLKEVRAPVRSISLEPLLEALPNLGEQLRENGVNWVIVGGESGTQARRLELSWIRDLIEECKGQEIPVFVKQLGTRWERENEDTSGKGEETEGWPEELKLRQYPEGADYLKEQGA